MERLNVRIGHLTFDRADYDEEGDVLYLPWAATVGWW